MPKPEMSYQNQDIDNPNNGETSQLSYLSKDDAADKGGADDKLAKFESKCDLFIQRMDDFAKRHGL